MSDLRPGTVGHVHVAGLQLGTQCGELLVLEVVLGRERLERTFFDRSTLLRISEKRLDVLFENDAQDRHFLSNRSIRLPLGADRTTPV